MPLYYRSDSLEESLQLMASKPLTVLAGATDIFPALTTMRDHHGRSGADYLDITAISALKGIAQRDTGWHIGAGVTWHELIRADLPAAFAGLQQAGREVGGPQVQSRGTVVGNLCNASPAADGVPPLLCLNAQVQLASADRRREVALSDFIMGNRRIDRQPDELVTGLRIPVLPTDSQGCFYKQGARRYLVISITSLAAVVCLQDRVIRDIRLAVGSCSLVPQRLSEAESQLLNCALSDISQTFVSTLPLPELAPIDDIRATADWRMRSVRTGLERLLLQWAEEAAA